MELIEPIIAGQNFGYIVTVVIAAFIVWFLPALLALLLNPKHFKLILIACIPAGFSVIAWCGVLVWATTGKVFDKWGKQSQPDN